jgi:hypothetical protein
MTIPTHVGLYSGPTAEDLACIPEALKVYPQWILFQLLEMPDKQGELKLNKIPINPKVNPKDKDFAYGSSTDGTTWDTLAHCLTVLPTALDRWDRKPPTRYKGKPATYKGTGLGFVFTTDDPYMLVDLDHSVDTDTGTIAPWAQTILDTLHSYTQRSVSGTGLHVLVQAQMPTTDMQHGDVQMWDHARFVAMTGWHVPGTLSTIEPRQSQLTMVHAAHILMPKAAAQAKKAPVRPTLPQSPHTSAPPRLSEQDILTIASRAKNSAKFNALWGGDISGYATGSEADEALLSLLAFYTRDPEQLDALFRQSGLMDEKWENRPDYRTRTIARALETVRTSYDPIAYKAEQAAKQDRNGHHARPAGLSSLFSLSSHSKPEQESPITTPDEPLSSLFSLSSQSIWPTMSEEAFHGLAGRVVKKISPQSESDPVALLMQLLTYTGVIVGRNLYFPVEATKHYPNLDVTLMGETSKARKGTSYDVIEWIMQTVDATWSHRNVISGCGSGEGLINAVRDPVIKQEPVKTKGKITGYEEVIVDAGVSDKRLLVYESEFASVLKVSLREGNILSMTLRQAWESGNLHNTVKTNPQHATNAHIALIGHITIEELRKLLSSTEAANGFGNRFLWLCVKRSQLLPDGGDLLSVDMQDIVDDLRKACKNARTITKMSRDGDATVIWHAIYEKLSEGKRGLPGALAARGEAQVLRLSMIYALLDGSAVIRPPHLYAALAVWEYVEASIAYVFDSATGHRDADTLLEALQGAQEGKMTKTEIISEVFHGHIRAHDLNHAIRVLADAGVVTRKGGASTGGRRKEYICYGDAASTSPNVRARTRYRELGKEALASHQQCVCDSKPCEESEKSEESPNASRDAGDAQICGACEESEKSEESLGEGALPDEYCAIAPDHCHKPFIPQGETRVKCLSCLIVLSE